MAAMIHLLASCSNSEAEKRNQEDTFLKLFQPFKGKTLVADASGNVEKDNEHYFHGTPVPQQYFSLFPHSLRTRTDWGEKLFACCTFMLNPEDRAIIVRNEKAGAPSALWLLVYTPNQDTLRTAGMVAQSAGSSDALHITTTRFYKEAFAHWATLVENCRRGKDHYECGYVFNWYEWSPAGVRTHYESADRIEQEREALKSVYTQ